MKHLKWVAIAAVFALLSAVFVAAPASAVAEDDNRAKTRANFHISDELGDASEVCDHDFSRARAWVQIMERDGESNIRIRVINAVPNELFTAWLKVDGSPITGIGATPLAPTTELTALGAVTPPAEGTTDQVNAFFTDAHGVGTLNVTLDFLLSDGFYPFPEGDTAVQDTPFTIRLASHCTDHVGHGLVPGVHERIFDVSL